MKCNSDKVKRTQKNYLRENPDLALQLENDVYKAVGMIESDSPDSPESPDEASDVTSEDKVPKATNKEK